MLTLERLAALWDQHQAAARHQIKPITIGPNGLEIGTTPKIMGVVNLSPQSWYRESVCLSPEAAIRRATTLCARGADIIDIGGESTLAHAERVTESQQIDLLVPLTQKVVANGVIVSIETYSSRVAEAVLEAGASVINMTGTEQSERIYKLAAQANAAVILCYVQGDHVRKVDALEFAGDPFDEFTTYFSAELSKAKALGLSKVIVDPGLGFYYRNLTDGKARIRYQMETFLETFRLKPLGHPVCHALPHAFELFETEVRSAEGFFAVLAALGQTHLFRTHEVSRIRPILQALSLV